MKQILYLFDPLCGWCYGFSNNMLTFSKKHRLSYEFVPIPGGMVIGDRVKPMREMRAYITKALSRVEEVTGCKFGEDFKSGALQSDEMILDSEPPSRALITFRTFDNDRSIEFAGEIQKAHFYHGKDLNQRSTYETLVDAFDLNRKAFFDRYDSLKMKQQVQEEFHWVKESGVQGYPTVVLRSANKYYMISHGFASPDQLDQGLDKAAIFLK